MRNLPDGRVECITGGGAKPGAMGIPAAPMRLPEATGKLAVLGRRLIACRACPRLVRYLGGIKRERPEYWCRPVPGFGDPEAEVVLVGLAPGRSGSNRSGRMFTGDASGRWLYRALHQVGLCDRTVSRAPGDGLRLRGVYITAAVRCAPPGNKPNRQELDQCRSWLAEELRLLRRARIFVGIGRIGHEAILKVYGHRLSSYPFGHGRVHRIGEDRILLDTYHCSRQNTNTGKLTWRMFIDVFRRARKLARRKDRPITQSTDPTA